MPVLHNKEDARILKKRLSESNEKRVTISFYRYVKIENPELFRDHLFTVLSKTNVFGRIYVAAEGINAQISVPEENLEAFKSDLYSISFLDGIRLNIAIDDNGKSFFKLSVKLRRKIVADGIDYPDFDVTKSGKHVNAEEFNTLTDDPEAVIVDMRNHYESEVGHFENAILPDVDTFREQLPFVAEQLKDKKDKPIIMYCTGGIRCEKAGAYMKYHGFENVYQLDGGIIEYARQVKNLGLKNKFHGKNFVFDERLGERISNEIIANCHQCGTPCDTHENCANSGCNLLFIQCDVCRAKYNNCCSDECKSIIALPEEEQAKLRSGKATGRLVFKKGRKLKTS